MRRERVSGTGLFRGHLSGRQETKAVHCIEVPASAVRSERTFKLPIEARPHGQICRPKRGLVELLMLAREVQGAVFADRTLSIAQIAERFRRKPAFIARVLRLNYLAPDIQTAILDGRQPADLTRKRLIFSSLPMDWKQQRALLGFAQQSDPMAGDIHY